MRNFMSHTALAGALAITLAACSGSEPEGTEETDMDAVTTDGEANLSMRDLVAADFMSLNLGAKIVGPQGPEVTGTLSNSAGNFADIRSFVACPGDMKETCDPKTAPEGTIYTYVHVVYPGEDNQGGTGSGDGNDSSDIESATAFYMTQRAHGFTGAAGYSKDEALAAIGDKAMVSVACDDGKLFWSVNAGDGGNQWEQAEPLTFFWQSTLPPAGPAEAYAIQANETEAFGMGPFPAETEGASNACVPATAMQAEPEAE